MNNICELAPIPEACRPLQVSYFYFVPNSGGCIDFVKLNDRSVIEVFDHVDMTDGIVLRSEKNAGIAFQGVVLCDPNFAEPNYSTKVVKKDVYFYIKSKYSCGKINNQAQSLDANSYLICTFLMLFGMLLLVYGGISFRSLVNLWLLTFATLIITIGALYLFDFQLRQITVTLLTGGALSLALILKWLHKTYVWLERIVAGFVGATFGINIAWSLNPDGYLFQQALIGFIVFTVIKLLMMGLVMIYADLFILIINSFLGATLFVYNLGYMSGYLPNFFALADEFTNEGEDIPMVYKINVAIMVVIALISIFGQLCHRKVSAKKPKKRSSNYDSQGYYRV